MDENNDRFEAAAAAAAISEAWFLHDFIVSY